MDENFTSIKSCVLLLDTIAEVYKVFGMILKLERQLNCVISGHTNNDIMQENASQMNVTKSASEDVAIAASGSSNVNSFNNKKRYINNGGGKSSEKCTLYGMSDHKIDKCYKKHGYPLGWVPGYKSKERQIQNQNQTSQASVSTVSQFRDLGISNDQFQSWYLLFKTRLDRVHQLQQ